MLVTLDEELQRERRKNLEDLAKFYGGGQPGQVDQIGAITAPRASYSRPIPTIRPRVRR
ncbi:unnamed protein product [marine sediment metagenome]|uniref:Uncharacterized protein n=1 Tax=marine sediment metagenome TaxID=412755 RepID=X1SMC6_9ZZZZ